MTTTPESTGIEAVVQQAMDHLGVPGMAWGILREDATQTGARGIAHLGTGEPMRADSLCRIASISKVFTATLAVLLADEGLLTLDTPVSQYLPGVRISEAGIENRVTLRHLLSHGSGIFGDFSPDCGMGDDALERAISEFHTLRQYADLDELWFYCNAGFHLAGRVIEVVAGQPFATVMRERVFVPLGLERTCFFAHEAIPWPHAVGHNQAAPDTNEHTIAGQYYPANRLPAGGVISNAPDLLRFARFHLGDGTVDGQRIVSAAALGAMQEPQREAANWADAWGIGWDIRWIDGVKIISHGGNINGFKSKLTLIPEHNAALALLTNSSRGDAANREVEEWFLTHDLGLHRAEPQRISLPLDVLEKLSGQYQNAATQLTVTSKGSELVLSMVAPGPAGGDPIAWPDTTLAPIGEHEFLLTSGDSTGERLDFVLHADGSPRFLRMHGRLYDTQ